MLGVKLAGSWEVVVGQLDTYVHILEYENYGGYDKTSRLVRETAVSTCWHLHATPYTQHATATQGVIRSYATVHSFPISSTKPGVRLFPNCTPSCARWYI